ncbi:hypothetical protein DTO282F9_7528 [Paecilomyces variotii]|nr:hypothetical protein DTO282F9_7528 [Paecilomyces variotii]
MHIDYHHARLYCFSPAAHSYHILKKEEKDSMGPEAFTLYEMAEEASSASVDMLKFTVHDFAPSKFLRYCGVRYGLYVVCCSLFLLKATLRREEQVDEHHPHIRLISDVVAAFRENAPDDIHMSQNYSLFLEVLVNAAVRPSTTTTSSSFPGLNSEMERRLPDEISVNATGLDMSSPGYMQNFGLDQFRNLSYGLDDWNSVFDLVGCDIIPDFPGF